MSKYYAVACGRQVGIFQTWTEAEKQVRGFPGAKHKRFDTEEEAKLYLENPVTKRYSELLSCILFFFNFFVLVKKKNKHRSTTSKETKNITTRVVTPPGMD